MTHGEPLGQIRRQGKAQQRRFARYECASNDQAQDGKDGAPAIGLGNACGKGQRPYYPRRKVRTWEAYSSGFSNGTQWPQLFSSTSRESSRLLRAAIPISKTHIRS